MPHHICYSITCDFCRAYVNSNTNIGVAQLAKNRGYKEHEIEGVWFCEGCYHKLISLGFIEDPSLDKG